MCLWVHQIVILCLAWRGSVSSLTHHCTESLSNSQSLQTLPSTLMDRELTQCWAQLNCQHLLHMNPSVHAITWRKTRELGPAFLTVFYVIVGVTQPLSDGTLWNCNIFNDVNNFLMQVPVSSLHYI